MEWYSFIEMMPDLVKDLEKFLIPTIQTFPFFSFKIAIFHIYR